MQTIAFLPADLGRWDKRQVDAALNERRNRVEGLFAHAGDDYAGLSSSELEEIRRLNSEITRLNGAAELCKLADDRPPLPNPQPGRLARPGHRSRSFASLGAEIISNLTGGTNDLFATFDSTGGGGTAAPSFFTRGVYAMPQRRLFLRDLLANLPVNSDKQDYLRQITSTNNAAVVAAGGQKPKSVNSIERVTAAIKVIGHMSEAIDRSLLMDFDALSQFLDEILAVQVLLAEENFLLNDATYGILNTVGINTRARGTEPYFDTVWKAITDCRLQFFEPEAVVLHPNDWSTIRLTRTADGEYIQGDPVLAGAERLFDKQVLVTPLIAQGTGLVGAFAAGATCYEREGVRVEWRDTGLGDSAGQELWDRNQIRWRAESRIGIGVQFPKAFTKLTL